MGSPINYGLLPIKFYCPVGSGCRIHWLFFCRGVSPPLEEYPEYDTKQSDGEVPVMLELWGMWSTPSWLLIPGPPFPGVVAPDKGPIYGLNRTNCICYILMYMFMRHHNDTIIKTHEGRRRETSLTKYIPLTLLQRFVQVLHVRGSWRPNINCNILTPLLWPSRCVFLVL